MEYKYCPACGNELVKKDIKDEGLVPFCYKCNRVYFSFAKLCVLVAIINERNEVILTIQNHIAKDKWILISGYIKQGETSEETAIREVKEETGQEIIHLKYIKSYFMESVNMLMLGFAAFVNAKPFILSDEITKIEWYNFEEATKKIAKNSIAEQLLLDVKINI